MIIIFSLLRLVVTSYMQMNQELLQDRIIKSLDLFNSIKAKQKYCNWCLRRGVEESRAPASQADVYYQFDGSCKCGGLTAQYKTILGLNNSSRYLCL